MQARDWALASTGDDRPRIDRGGAQSSTAKAGFFMWLRVWSPGLPAQRVRNS